MIVDLGDVEKRIAFCRTQCACGVEGNVSINLSLKSLIEPHLANRVLEIAKNPNIETRRICLELAESTATTDVATALENLTRLRMHRFGLSSDHYGTGYSSMRVAGARLSPAAGSATVHRSAV